MSEAYNYVYSAFKGNILFNLIEFRKINLNKNKDTQ